MNEQVQVTVAMLLPGGATMQSSETTLTARDISFPGLADWGTDVMARYVANSIQAGEPLSKADLALYFVARASDEYEALPARLRNLL